MDSSVNKNETRTFLVILPPGSLFLLKCFFWERFSFYGIRPLLILFMAATVYRRRDRGWRVKILNIYI